jgi:hypothetical protein
MSAEANNSTMSSRGSRRRRMEIMRRLIEQGYEITRPNLIGLP